MQASELHPIIKTGGERPAPENWEELSPHPPWIVSFRGRSGKCRHFVCNLKCLTSWPPPTHYPSTPRKSLEDTLGSFLRSLREQLLGTLFTF